MLLFAFVFYISMGCIYYYVTYTSFDTPPISCFISSPNCDVIVAAFMTSYYPTALNGCWGIVFTHGVRMVGRAAGNSLSGLYLRNRKV